MSTSERRCPECNAIIKPNESFCLNCGATVPQEENVVPAGQGGMADTLDVNPDALSASNEDSISRSNIMGSVNKTNNTTVNNESTTTVNDCSSTTTNNTQNVNTNVINRNSSTSTSNSNNVTNTNNTIIHQQAAPEFCTVCGKSLNNGNKARCPKCQKTICSDCLVSGKNRCTECEKKALDEYRLAFQELVYTTNGNIGVAGERVMKRKAEELNVVESATKIEDDIMALFRSSKREEQQQQSLQAEESKGVGSLSGRTPLTMSKEEKKSNGGGTSKSIFAVILVIVVAVVGYFYFAGGDKATEKVSETKNEQIDAKKRTEVKNETEPKAAVQPEPQKPAQAKTVQKKAAPVVKDNNYEEGMKAYEANNGVEAVKKFKASGSAKSQYMIGIIYENGCGSIAKNAMKARQAFKEAAKLGSEEAKAKL